MNAKLPYTFDPIMLHNLDEIVYAAKTNRAALALCRNRETGKEQVLLCGVNHHPDKSIELVPFAVMIDMDPHEMYDPPEKYGGFRPKPEDN
jgi:hypothetical protein